MKHASSLLVCLSWVSETAAAAAGSVLWLVLLGAIRVESGCSSLKIVGPPHQTQKVVGRLAKIQLEFGCYPVPLRRTYNTT